LADMLLHWQPIEIDKHRLLVIIHNYHWFITDYYNQFISLMYFTSAMPNATSSRTWPKTDEVQTFATVIIMVDSTRYYVQKTCYWENHKTRRLRMPLCGHTTFVQPTPAFTTTIIDKIMIYSNDVNKHDLPSNYWQ